jgi:hypothetical protein
MGEYRPHVEGEQWDTGTNTDISGRRKSERDSVEGRRRREDYMSPLKQGYRSMSGSLIRLILAHDRDP